ncbi:MAG: SH3 domain-containing protein [Bacteroidota bacterium]
MAKSKKSKGSNMQTLFVGVSIVMMLLLILAVRSCSNSEGEYSMVGEEEARQNYLDSLQTAEEEAAREAEIQARAEALLRAQTQPPLGDSVIREPILGGGQVIRQAYTPLYVCTDFANVRSGPGLNFGKVERLALYDEVEYLNEKTDSTYQIDLGEITPDAPWVKIRTSAGKEGWVYGACVHYYKYRLEGVETD